MGGDWFTKPLLRAVAAGVLLVSHLAVAAGIILCIWALDHFVHWLWNDREPTLFGVMPLIYLFHAMDAGVLLVFAFWGIVEANQVFRGKDHGG